MQIFLTFFAKKCDFSCIYQNLFVNLCVFSLRIAPNDPKSAGSNGVIVLIMVRALCVGYGLRTAQVSKKNRK